ncbi:hypothetical protein OsI_19709 [Oryza sativa Indica Group]|uniref:Uncharacterized protein n=1 Tax=Oryza sativa subsp. indica TaxID=39946 RepID=B8AXG6_ORYSI|nr:hypothetical protein OsI_19709 [Oryza sativa Indica Group]
MASRLVARSRRGLALALSRAGAGAPSRPSPPGLGKTLGYEPTSHLHGAQFLPCWFSTIASNGSHMQKAQETCKPVAGMEHSDALKVMEGTSPKVVAFSPLEAAITKPRSSPLTIESSKTPVLHESSAMLLFGGFVTAEMNDQSSLVNTLEFPNNLQYPTTFRKPNSLEIHDTSETSEHFHRGILNSDPAINQPALAVISEVQMYHVSVQPSNAAVENRELKGVLGFGFFTFSLILFFFSLAPAFISSYLILSSPYGWFCKSGPEVLAAMQPQDP